MLGLHHIRIVLYTVLFLFSTVLLGLTAARLYYTTHIPLGDPLNGGADFYDPIIAELLATSILTMLWSLYIIHVIHGVHERRPISLFRGELIGVFILFLLYLVGAAVTSSYWGDLAWCQVYKPCRILTTIVAFAWMGWIILFFLLVFTFLWCLSNEALLLPLHGRWNARASTFGTGRR